MRRIEARADRVAHRSRTVDEEHPTAFETTTPRPPPPPPPRTGRRRKEVVKQIGRTHLGSAHQGLYTSQRASAKATSPQGIERGWEGCIRGGEGKGRILAADRALAALCCLVLFVRVHAITEKEVRCRSVRWPPAEFVLLNSMRFKWLKAVASVSVVPGKAAGPARRAAVRVVSFDELE